MAKPNRLLRKIFDPTLAKALSHPFRSHILCVTNERTCSPSEIAREVGIEVTSLDYHVKTLMNKHFIELVGTEPRRGVSEHFYRATKRCLLDDREWARVPASIRSDMSADLLGLIVDEAVEAVKAGSFDTRNTHMSRTALRVDEQGWNELMQVKEESLKKVLAIQKANARRLEKAGKAGIPAIVAMAGFERAPAPGEDAGCDGVSMDSN